MIAENPSARDRIMDMAKRYLSGAREGIHVSSLIYPLKHYYRVRHPDVALSDRLVGLFIAGRGHHSVIQMLAALPQYREVRVEWMGIRGTIDIFEDRVVEIKTTRVQTPLTPERVAREHREWIDQIRYYCAMVGSGRAQLWVFYLGLRDGSGRLTPHLQVFDVDAGDLEAARAEMLGRKQVLERALSSGDPSLLPRCPDWMCRECEFGGICIASPAKAQEAGRDVELEPLE
jgi:hypothetical protein